uniref:Timeless N-terminal domain-containing protein n=1 Tax=Chromera velia CCMP2878 TaxID=1169474 RepID=A0A0K6SBA7_9ALVE|eukprot:Cvel_13823.t1-p1 / transcript=Cvel_13823.t1 / gene=Cvel_13823 / organism=Chromera_velia_CCMP2878 / gene_product=Uncharacterized protein PFB0460c, putative / transcript_product=Uncharacterized protein PFB0460c, putative / location=Cvel_scaffold959:44382-61175(-) / protein_length=1629 / sequence_SO=supercontig / SO=protein_coding / is_pseudo=false
MDDEELVREVEEDVGSSLHFSLDGLGGLLESKETDINGRQKTTHRYIAKNECDSCLKDLIRFLLQDDKKYRKVRRYLGSWNVVRHHLVPLWLDYRDDVKKVRQLLRLFVLLTEPPDGADFPNEIIEFQQSEKSTFATEDVFKVLWKVYVDARDTLDDGPSNLETIQQVLDEARRNERKLWYRMQSYQAAIADMQHKLDAAAGGESKDGHNGSQASQEKTGEDGATEGAQNAPETREQTDDAAPSLPPSEANLELLRKQVEKLRLSREIVQGKLREAETDKENIKKEMDTADLNRYMSWQFVRNLLKIPDPPRNNSSVNFNKTNTQFEIVSILLQEEILENGIDAFTAYFFEGNDRLSSFVFLDVFYFALNRFHVKDLLEANKMRKLGILSAQERERGDAEAAEMHRQETLQKRPFFDPAREARNRQLRRLGQKGGQMTKPPQIVRPKTRPQPTFYRQKREDAKKDFPDIAKEGDGNCARLHVSETNRLKLYTFAKKLVFGVTFKRLMERCIQELEQPSAASERDKLEETNLLNLMSWVLSFSRERFRMKQYFCKKRREVDEARGTVSDAPDAYGQQMEFDLWVIKPALDEKALRLSLGKVRQCGRESKMREHMQLRAGLRLLLEQLKIIEMLVLGKDPQRQQIAQALLNHMFENDTMHQDIAWTMKFYTPTVHHPDVLLYAVEIAHVLVQQVELAEKSKIRMVAQRGRKIKKKQNPAEGGAFEGVNPEGGTADAGEGPQEAEVKFRHFDVNYTDTVGEMCDYRVVRNCFAILNSWKVNSAKKNRLAVSLLYSVFRLNEYTKQLFFQLQYLWIVHRVLNSAGFVLEHPEHSCVYVFCEEVINSFVEAFTKNSLLVVECLFRKGRELGFKVSGADQLQALQDDYEEGTKLAPIIAALNKGQSVAELRAKFKEMNGIKVLWTDEMEKTLRESFERFRGSSNMLHYIAGCFEQDMTAGAVRNKLKQLGLWSRQNRGSHEGHAAGEEGEEEDPVGDDEEAELVAEWKGSQTWLGLGKAMLQLRNGEECDAEEDLTGVDVRGALGELADFFDSWREERLSLEADGSLREVADPLLQFEAGTAKELLHNRKFHGLLENLGFFSADDGDEWRLPKNYGSRFLSQREEILREFANESLETLEETIEDFEAQAAAAKDERRENGHEQTWDGSLRHRLETRKYAERARGSSRILCAALVRLALDTFSSCDGSVATSKTKSALCALWNFFKALRDSIIRWKELVSEEEEDANLSTLEPEPFRLREALEQHGRTTPEGLTAFEKFLEAFGLSKGPPSSGDMSQMTQVEDQSECFLLPIQNGFFWSQQLQSLNGVWEAVFGCLDEGTAVAQREILQDVFFTDHLQDKVMPTLVGDGPSESESAEGERHARRPSPSSSAPPAGKQGEKSSEQKRRRRRWDAGSSIGSDADSVGADSSSSAGRESGVSKCEKEEMEGGSTASEEAAEQGERGKENMNVAAQGCQPPSAERARRSSKRPSTELVPSAVGEALFSPSGVPKRARRSAPAPDSERKSHMEDGTHEESDEESDDEDEETQEARRLEENLQAVLSAAAGNRDNEASLMDIYMGAGGDSPMGIIDRVHGAEGDSESDSESEVDEAEKAARERLVSDLLAAKKREAAASLTA